MFGNGEVLLGAGDARHRQNPTYYQINRVLLQRE